MTAVRTNLRFLHSQLGTTLGTRIEQTSLQLSRSFRNSLRTSHGTRSKVRPVVRFCSSAASEESTTNPVKTAPDPSALDIRVGKILTCERHPEADDLYIEEINVGEETPRTICSGLVPYVSVDDLLDKTVVVLCNLRVRKFRGVKSHGMLLCASDKEGGNVAPLIPPVGSSIGERVFFETDGGETQPAPDSENRMRKRKIWEQLQPMLKTDSNGVACFQEQTMKLASGVVTCPTLPNTQIS